jgi:hypothetical protein
LCWSSCSKVSVALDQAKGLNRLQNSVLGYS